MKRIWVAVWVPSARNAAKWLLGGPLDRPLRADAMGEQEALQLVEITWSERLVAAQALHGEVILVNLEEVLGAKAELHILDETTYRLSGSDQLRKTEFLADPTLKLAQLSEHTKTFHLRQLIEAGLDNLEDAYLGVSVSELGLHPAAL